MPEAPMVFFRLADGPVRTALEARTEHGLKEGLVARRDLERYYQVLADELSTVNLSEPEASLIVDVCNGTLFESFSYQLLWANISDAGQEYGDKWGVDMRKLTRKIRAFTPGQNMAVVDSISRFWSDATRPTGDQLRAVGLVRGAPNA